ncbi:hypothetical protein T11_14008 [Trichinella zimbabwensis]|uniref:Uncharacterized protein n=1 Tax=Trichinella zimbabwensis TaxID=268475 RepID=A0A0V1GTN0_9BILA|nr:hypothetical protein T11_14008 [Trichinella zimbabwensis]
MDPRNQEAARCIVYTEPEFPKALRGCIFPPAEIQKRHLFICLTIKETRTIRIAIPLIYHNDIPDAEIDLLQNLKKWISSE